MKKILYAIILTGVLGFACSKEQEANRSSETIYEMEKAWIVPLENLVLTKLPLDLIPSIDSP